ncbi:hypothetical protein F5Y16DRAFT_371605 [Xylariaceae sp. FL0255]|nr:hypothetical protein F5Y16DRAFT_371605 [Xylariaceae sp. FL0255]
MKLISITLALALAGAAVAQNGLPPCAQNCLAEFTTGNSIGNCPRLDAKCICSNNSFISSIACCLSSVCDAADQQAAVNFAVTFCKTQGVTVPSAVSCATASQTSMSTSVAKSATGLPAETSTTTITAAASATATTTPNTGVPSRRSTSAKLGGLLAVLALI